MNKLLEKYTKLKIAELCKVQRNMKRFRKMPNNYYNRKSSIQSEGAGPGTSILTVLCIVFAVLKLVGTIDWSWWWITSPMWGQVVLLVVLLLIKIIMKAGGK